MSVGPGDDTLAGDSTVASLAPDASYTTDIATDLAAGATTIAAAEAQAKQLRDEAAWRAANGSL